MAYPPARVPLDEVCEVVGLAANVPERSVTRHVGSRPDGRRLLTTPPARAPGQRRLADGTIVVEAASLWLPLSLDGE
jgi:hypothetical protein